MPCRLSGPDVVAERVPEPLHVVGRGRGEGLEGGVAVEELVVLGHHAIDLGLLEHDLGDQDVVGIARAPPRQVAPVRPYQASRRRRKRTRVRRSGREASARRPLCTRFAASRKLTPQSRTWPSSAATTMHADGADQESRLARPAEYGDAAAHRRRGRVFDRSIARQGQRDGPRPPGLPAGHAHQRREGPRARGRGAGRLPRRPRQGHGRCSWSTPPRTGS